VAAYFLNRALGTRLRNLPDGRCVTVRRAVPSDAPRLVYLGGGPESAWGCELVALDARGTVIGHAVAPTRVTVAPAWRSSGLSDVLAHELQEA
jgi:hypothetical protein